MVRLAVLAHIRHRETGYDELMGKGSSRNEARSRVWERVDQISEGWR